MGDPMPTSPDTFDPLAVVADWLNACRWRELDALLNLYDERATLECDCEHVSLTGRKWIAAYWAPKLESRAVLRSASKTWP
jgi:ketosteroid isomerase-like protein